MKATAEAAVKNKALVKNKRLVLSLHDTVSIYLSSKMKSLYTFNL